MKPVLDIQLFTFSKTGKDQSVTDYRLLLISLVTIVQAGYHYLDIPFVAILD